MSFYNVAQDIGHLANTHIAQYSHNLNHAFHAMQEISISLADKAMYNPVTVYANELYHKSIALSGGDIHPDGKKLIIGAVAFIIISLGIYGLINYHPGHGAGDNSLSSADSKKKKSLKHPDN